MLAFYVQALYRTRGFFAKIWYVQAIYRTPKMEKKMRNWSGWTYNHLFVAITHA